MANLSDILRADAPESLIDRMYEGEQSPRAYLGLSEIGNPCSRYLWYRHNGYELPKKEGRMLRLLELGNILEAKMISDLLTSGVQVFGQQVEVVIDPLKGHIDGMALGLKESKKIHLLEFKTCKQESFNKLHKAGSYEAWDEKYKAQVQVYMYGLGLERCLSMVYNKNTSEIRSYRIKLDRTYAKEKIDDGLKAISYKSAPTRLCNKDDFWVANMCGYKGICFNG